MKKIAVMLILAVFAGGCAGKKPYATDPKKSFALNALRAGGAHQIRDVSRKKFEDQGDAALAGQVRGNESGLGGTLLAALSGGLLFGASYWAVGEKAPESRSAIMAWMPVEEAQNQEDALKKLMNLLDEALGSSIVEVGLPDNYSIQRLERNAIVYNISGEECDQAKVRCNYFINPPKKPMPVLGFAPESLGGYRAWVWSFNNKNQIYFAFPTHSDPSFRGLKKAKFPDFEIYTKMSSKLPGWVFAYISPMGNYTFVSEAKGDGFSFIRHPMVLNEGATHLFVSP